MSKAFKKKDYLDRLESPICPYLHYACQNHFFNTHYHIQAGGASSAAGPVEIPPPKRTRLIVAMMVETTLNGSRGADPDPGGRG
jgi:hypothetical protein